jgi:hypothetical protein
MDQGEGVFPRALSLVREGGGERQRQTIALAVFSSMYGGVFLGGLESAAGNKLGKMVCEGKPLSTLVKMGGRSALCVVHITRLVAPGHEAHFSLPQSVAFAAGTIMHADVLPQRSVV